MQLERSFSTHVGADGRPGWGVSRPTANSGPSHAPSGCKSAKWASAGVEPRESRWLLEPCGPLTGRAGGRPPAPFRVEGAIYRGNRESGRRASNPRPSAWNTRLARAGRTVAEAAKELRKVASGTHDRCPRACSLAGYCNDCFVLQQLRICPRNAASTSLLVQRRARIGRIFGVRRQCGPRSTCRPLWPV
jgi:hypothetical protein